MTEIKINCGVHENKKNERRGTMQECVDKKQVRYYGVKTIDKILLNELNKRKKPEKKLSSYNLHELTGLLGAMKRNAERKREIQAIAKKHHQDTQVAELENEINEIKLKYKKYAVRQGELFEKEERKKEAEKKKSKEAEKKKKSKEAEKKKKSKEVEKKKSSKKTSKKESKKPSKK